MYHNEDSAPRCAELLLSERGVIPHQLPPGHRVRSTGPLSPPAHVALHPLVTPWCAPTCRSCSLCVWPSGIPPLAAQVARVVLPDKSIMRLGTPVR